MNFAPLWRSVLADELDLFQVHAICQLRGLPFSQAYIAAKFSRYLSRDYEPRFIATGRKPLTITL